MADLHGPRPELIWLCIRGCGWCCLVQAVATTAPGTTDMAIAHRAEPALFQEIARSAVPVDLRAIRQLQRSPLAIDLYVWLTYRMSYLRRPTLVPWEGLQAQFGADYSRPRDFRRGVMKHLETVIGVYPTLRVSQADSGLRLYPSRPHVQPSKRPAQSRLSKVSDPQSITARPLNG